MFFERVTVAPSTVVCRELFCLCAAVDVFVIKGVKRKKITTKMVEKVMLMTIMMILMVIIVVIIIPIFLILLLILLLLLRCCYWS